MVMANWLKKGLVLSCVVALGWMLPGHAEAADNVTGTIELEGATRHSGTVVRFLPVGTGSEVTRTTSTSGAFSATLAAGTYRIRIEPAGLSPLWLVQDKYRDMAVVNDLDSVDSAVHTSTFSLDGEYNLPFDVTIQSISLMGIVTLNSPSSEGTVLTFSPEGSTAEYSPDTPTDGDGNYAMDLMPGAYTIKILPKGSTPVWMSRNASSELVTVDSIDKASVFNIDSISSRKLDVLVDVPSLAVSGTVSLSGALTHAGTVLRFWPVDAVGAASVSPDQATDDGGHFSVDLLPGSYTVEVEPEGSSPVWLGSFVAGKPTVVGEVDLAVPLLIGTTSNLTFNVSIMLPPVSISGSVTRTGVDVLTYAGTVLEFLPVDAVAGTTTPSAITDSDGVFNVSLSAGFFKIRLNPVGSSPVWLGQDEEGWLTIETDPEQAFSFLIGTNTDTNPILDVTMETQSVSGIIALTGTATLQGTVVRFSPTSVANAVEVLATTDSDGRYSVELLPGVYTVSIQPQGSDAFWLGAESDGVYALVDAADQSVPLVINAGFSQPVGVTIALQPVLVSGTLSLSGVASHAGVDLHFFIDGMDIPTSFLDATDVNGNFSVSLSPGSYTIKMQPEGSSPVWLNQSDSHVLTVSDTVENASLFLVGTASNPSLDVTVVVPPIVVTGSILTEVSTHEGTLVQFLPVGSTVPFSPANPTNSSGDFMIELPPGSYTVSMQPVGYPPVWLGPTVEGVRTLVTHPDLAASFTITEENESDKTFDVVLPLVAVSGVVKLTGTATHAGTALHFWPMDVRVWPTGTLDMPAYPADEVTSDNGAFSVDLLPGTYVIEIQPHGSPSVWLAQGTAGALMAVDVLQDATPFPINMGVNQTFDVSMFVSPVAVSGTLLLEGVASHAGTMVHFWLEDSDTPVSLEQATDATGAFAVSLAPGAYRIEIQPLGSDSVFLGKDGSENFVTVVDEDDAPFLLVGAEALSLFDVTVAVPPITVTGNVSTDTMTQAGTVLSFMPRGVEGLADVSVSVEEGGDFSVGLMPGSYTVKIQPVNASPIWLGQDDSGDGIVVGDAAYASPYEVDFTEDANPTLNMDVPVFSVSGTVLLAGASDQEGTVVRFLPTSVSEAFAVSTTTDIDGNFSMDVLPGSYTVELQFAGAASQWLGRHAVGTPMLVDQVGEAALFAIDSQSNRLFEVVIPSLPVSGTVTLTGFEDHAGTVVRFWPVGVADALVAPVSQTTDSEGNFSLLLIPGTYTVEIKPGAFSPVWMGPDATEGRTTVWRAGKAFAFYIGPDVNQTFQVALNQDRQVALVSLEGSVQVDHVAVTGALVRLWSTSTLDPHPIEVSTDSQGAYDLSLPSDLYRVELQLPEKAPVFVGLSDDALLTAQKSLEDAHPFFVGGAPGRSTLALDFASEDIPVWVALTGTIRAEQQVVANAEVRVWPVSEEAVDPLETITDRLGAYAFELTPGLYRMDVRLPGKTVAFVGVDAENRPLVAPNADSAFVFAVGEDAWRVIDVNVSEHETDPLMRLSGSVIWENGSAVAGVPIRVWSGTGDHPLSFQGMTDAGGRYLLNIERGVYRLEAQLPGKAPLFFAVDAEFPQSPDQIAVASLAEASSYGVEDDTEVDLTIHERMLQPLIGVSGQILMVEGTETLPVRGVPVFFKPVDASGVETVQAITDVYGRYDINMPSGSYIMEVHPEDATPLFVGSGGTPSDAPETLVLSTDSIINLTFSKEVLVMPAAVRGTIQWQGGVSTEGLYAIPAVGAKVSLALLSDPGQVLVGMTDEQGHYAMDVTPGLYRMQVQVQGFVSVYMAWNEAGHYESSKDPLEAFSFDFQTAGSEHVVDLLDATLARERVDLGGRVTDADGQGVAGLRVEIQPDFDANAINNGVLETVITGSEGDFSLSVIPGRYRVAIQTRYWDGSKEVIVQDVAGDPLNLIAGFADGQGGVVSSVEEAGLFVIASDTTLAMQMKAGVLLSGHVWKTAEMGSEDAVVGAEVAIHYPDGTGVISVQTGADGGFSVHVDPDRRYVIEVWPVWCETSDTTCEAGRDDFVGGNLVVREADFSEVVVRTSGGEPVIVASHAEGQGVSLSGKILGTWSLQEMTQFKVDQPLDLDLFIDNGTILKGRVQDLSGNGVRGAWVESGMGGAETTSEGLFELVLPSSASGADSFTVQIYPAWCDPSDADFAACEDKKVLFSGGVVSLGEGGYGLSSAEADGKAFLTDGTGWPTGESWLIVTVRQAVSITGQVVLEGTQQGIPNLWVDVWSHTTATGRGTLTNAEGYFSIPVEPPDDGEILYYEVGVWAPDHVAPDSVLARVESTGMTGVYLLEAGEETSAMPIPTPGDRIEGDTVHFALSQGQTLRGRVVDANGKGLSEAWVDVHNLQGTRFFGTSTDEDGFYILKVAAGSYVAVVWGDGERLRTTWYSQAVNEEGATLIDVTTGSRDDIDFRVTAGTSIRGTITGGSSGTVFVDAWSEATQSWGGKEVTLEADGSTSFVLSGLQEASDYRLHWDSETFMDGFYGGTLAGAPSGPVGRRQARLLDTTNDDVEGVNINLGTGNALTLVVSGMQVGEKVEVSVWSEGLNLGGWAEAVVEAGADGAVATLIVKDLDPSGTDYRLFVQPVSPHYLAGNFRASSSAAGGGTLAGWEQATLISMVGDLSLQVQVGQGGAIAGTVRGLASGKTAWVEAYSEETQGWGGVVVTGGAGDVAYTLQGLEKAGDYLVSISGVGVMRGYYPGPDSETLVRWMDAAPVDVQTEAGAKGINLTVSKGMSISGTITGKGTNNGLRRGEWAWLDAWSDSTSSWAGVVVEAHAENSGADVVYTLEGLAPASDYHVFLSAEGYVQQNRDGVDVQATVSGLDFTLSKGGSMRGAIRGLGAGSSAWVEAFSLATDVWVGVDLTADASGAASYILEGLAVANDYVVVLQTDDGRFYHGKSATTPVWGERNEVSVIGVTEAVDFDLSSASNSIFRLSGEVTLSPANSDRKVEIRAWSQEGSGAWAFRKGGGAFTLKGLTSGSYVVEVFAEGYMPQRTKTVVVTSGAINSDTLAWTSGWGDTGTVAMAAHTSGLNVTLNTGFTLRGTVTHATTGVMSGVWVSAWDAATSMGSGAVTDSRGQYTLSGLPGGTYAVEVWTSTGTDAKTQVLGDDASTEQTVDLTITPNPGGIGGTVKSSTGFLEQGLMVLIFKDDAQVAVAATDAEGAFEISGLEAGDYTVKAFGDAGFSTTHAYREVSVTVAGSVVNVGTMRLLAPATTP